MKGLSLNVNPRFVRGNHGAGDVVPAAENGRRLRRVDSPKTLALFDLGSLQHVSTGVSEARFLHLAEVSDTSPWDATEADQELAGDILHTAQVDVAAFEAMSPEVRVRTAVSLGRGELSAAWVAANTEALTEDNAELIDIGKMLHADYAYALAQQRGGVQDPAVSFHTRLALDVAQRVVDDQGSVDLVRLAMLTDQLLADETGRALVVGPHRAGMIALLEHMQMDPDFVPLLEQIVAPPADSPQEDLLRATLDKPAGALTDRDAKVAVLSAMLSHLRQGKVGSCFGTCVAIHLKEHRPNQTLAMLQTLVEDGLIHGGYQRNAQAALVALDIPLNLSALDLPFHQRLALDHEGFIHKAAGQTLAEPVALKDLPGFQHALSALGITDEVEQTRVLADAAEHLAWRFFNADTSAAEILAKVVDRAGLVDDAGLEKAEIAFHAAMENRLLRAFEYTLSGFSETHKAGKHYVEFANMVIGLFQTPQVYEELDGTIARVHEDDRQQYGDFAYDFQIRLQERLFRAVALRYEPTMASKERRNDGNSSHGGFGFVRIDPATGKQREIRTADELAEVVSGVFISQVYADMEAIAHAGYRDGGLVADEHLDLMNLWGAAFQREDLGRMLLEQDASLTANPIGYPGGADSQRVVRTLFPNSGPLSQAVLPRNPHRDAHALLSFVLETLQQVQDEMADPNNDYDERDVAQISLPVSNGTHAFLVKPGLLAGFEPVLYEGADIPTFLMERLASEAMLDFAQQPLDAEEVNRVVAALAKRYDLDKAGIQRALAALPELTPGAVFEAIQAGIPEGSARERSEERIGFLLAHHFQAPVDPILFADSNWGNGDVDVHLGVVTNPFTRQPELWKFDYNGEDWRPGGIPSQRDFVQARHTILNKPDQFGY